MPYSGCLQKSSIDMVDGVFTTTLPVQTDKRSYEATLKFSPSKYVAMSTNFFVDGFVKSSKLETMLTMATKSDRQKFGAYKFRVWDAIKMEPL